jgi:hypothetical protein
MPTKPTRSQLVAAIFFGLLPYVGGLLVIVTRNIFWLTITGVLICIASTTGTYILRKTYDPVLAKHRLTVDPMLYGIEFVFIAVLIRYLFMRSELIWVRQRHNSAKS